MTSFVYLLLDLRRTEKLPVTVSKWRQTSRDWSLSKRPITINTITIIWWNTRATRAAKGEARGRSSWTPTATAPRDTRGRSWRNCTTASWSADGPRVRRLDGFSPRWLQVQSNICRANVCWHRVYTVVGSIIKRPLCCYVIKKKTKGRSVSSRWRRPAAILLTCFCLSKYVHAFNSTLQFKHGSADFMTCSCRTWILTDLFCFPFRSGPDWRSWLDCGGQVSSLPSLTHWTERGDSCSQSSNCSPFQTLTL